jgi:hypothetical protein
MATESETREQWAARQPARAPRTFQVRVKISAKVMDRLIASGRLLANRTHDDFAVQRALQSVLHDECAKERTVPRSGESSASSKISYALSTISRRDSNFDCSS